VDEADARVARLDFFSAASRDWGFRGIALGHHADDAAETFLQRAVRGGGSEALVAPDAVQKLEGRGIVLLRPLINLRRNALEGAARQAGVVWREDATNAGDAHERNRIRRHVLPALSQASGRDAAGGIIAARARLLEEAEVVAWAWERFKGVEAGHWHSRNHLQVSALLDLPRLFRERVLREWLVSKSRGVLPSRAWLAGPLAALERREDSGTWTLAAGLRLKLAGDRLILGP
jgi:tRNA(Ile)-lysidine synthase